MTKTEKTQTIAAMFGGIIVGVFGVLTLDACVSCNNARELGRMYEQIRLVAEDNHEALQRVEALEADRD